MKIVSTREFANGKVYLLRTADGFLIEATDTFLPYYTKEAIGRKQNALTARCLGSRDERWMIGVSVMSGCPVRCKFCATGQMRRWRSLTAAEIVAQVDLILSENPGRNPVQSREFKINYTRMGEPFLNIEAVKEAIAILNARHPGTHHYLSTIGVKDSDYSWIKDNITLQISLHSLDEKRRTALIPYKRKLRIGELGEIRVQSRNKVTLNLTLVDEKDFSIDALEAAFPPQHFFVKLSPINPNAIADKNGLGRGVIEQANLL